MIRIALLSLAVATLLAACATRSSTALVSVTTRIQRATPECVEARVTVPLERVLSRLQGVESIRSRTSEAESHIEVSFTGLGAEEARGTVEEALSRGWTDVDPRISKPAVRAISLPSPAAK